MSDEDEEEIVVATEIVDPASQKDAMAFGGGSNLYKRIKAHGETKVFEAMTVLVNQETALLNARTQNVNAFVEHEKATTLLDNLDAILDNTSNEIKTEIAEQEIEFGDRVEIKKMEMENRKLGLKLEAAELKARLKKAEGGEDAPKSELEEELNEVFEARNLLGKLEELKKQLLERELVEAEDELSDEAKGLLDHARAIFSART